MKEDIMGNWLNNNKLNKLFLLAFIALVNISFSQTEDELEALEKASKNSNDLVFEGNQLLGKDDFVSAEKEYRKAISEHSSNLAGAYNLGNSYYNKGKFDEALFRQQQALDLASTKEEKHKAFHNIGNILMQNKQCKEAVEAYKNALRNNPSDDETRYNFALAKECAKQQQDQQNDQNDQDQDKDKEDQQKDDQNKDNQDQQDQQDNQDQQDKGDPKDDQGDQKDQDQGDQDQNQDQQNKGDQEKEQPQQPKPQPGQLSPQQIKSLLEAMNNQEQKVQEKMNAEKQKGVRVRTEKDW
ncbi:tetratricopeptide repeat protein [Aegicerativicinus sediminis]|uniref:tetratricopeptide repeat protein n=1 Tax=Aegicerativicinus sediminis TaxID=2893202 RepID=UPI001E4E770F|nr:tetratricopeptide repeat protein [Aegicerativicinus sediminis]